MSLRDGNSLKAAPFRFPALSCALFVACLGFSGKAASAIPQAPVSSAEPPMQSTPQATGTIQGTVVDRTGGVISGAKITLFFSQGDSTTSLQTVSGDEGQFLFSSV